MSLVGGTDLVTTSSADVRVGDRVLAEDGTIGHVDRVIRAESHAPAFLVVAAGRRLWRRYPVVPSALVARVDGARRTVHLRGRRRSIGELSERLPIVV